MRRLRLLYPFLFVVLPVLNVLTRNPGGSIPSDVVTLLVILLAACALAYVLVALVFRRGLIDPLVPLIVLAGLLWFYAYPMFRSFYRVARATPAPVLVGIVVVMLLGLATIAGIWWLARRPLYLDRLTTFFALTGVLLVGSSGFHVIADQIAARRSLRQSQLVRELAAPVSRSGGRSPAAEEPRRDIYLIIMDEYANSSVLRERFGFDNAEFEDSLRQLGFVVPKVIRSNYVHTLLSLPSLLNFSHLTRLAVELGTGNTDPTVPDYLVENNRTAAYLKSQGYKFLFFPSQWWISTGHNRNADWEFHAWSGLDPVRDATRSDLRRAFIGTTPLALLHNSDGPDADHVKRTLSAIAEVPHRPEPTFTLAHILNPHYPYVFDANCHTLATRPASRWGHGREDAYLNQVRCLNSLVLKTVTALVQSSEPAPIILLVGDHGTNSLGYSEARSAEAVSPAQARERFGAFGAFLLPGEGARHLVDTVTLVNLVPKVLNHYLGAGIHLAPDKLYMSLERTPYLFAEVDPNSLSR
jgi:hypothetical protein